MPIDLIALQEQGINFMLQQAANWARIPTRLNRADAARVIVEQAALQQQKQSALNTMSAVRAAIAQTRQMYDAGSSEVADVMDQWRQLPPGTVPPLSMLPKGAKVLSMVATVTGSLTEIERQIAESASGVLTLQQQQQLFTGLSFPKYIGTQATALIKYIAIGGGFYLLIRALMRSGGTRSW